MPWLDGRRRTDRDRVVAGHARPVHVGLAERVGEDDVEGHLVARPGARGDARRAGRGSGAGTTPSPCATPGGLGRRAPLRRMGRSMRSWSWIPAGSTICTRCSWAASDRSRPSRSREVVVVLVGEQLHLERPVLAGVRADDARRQPTVAATEPEPEVGILDQGRARPSSTSGGSRLTLPCRRARRAMRPATSVQSSRVTRTGARRGGSTRSLRRVEGERVDVGEGAHPEAVVEPLLEHAEGGDGGTVDRSCGDGLAGHP